MSSEIRQQRVAELLFEELNIMVSGELADPRVSLVTVTHVDISKDLRNARVYVNHQDDTVRKRDLLKALEHATPWMRGQLATRITLQFVPDLNFQYDDSPERAARVDEILRQLSTERPAPATPPADNR